MVQKIYSKMHFVSSTNTHHDVTDLVNLGMVQNTKTWISWVRNITFLRNKKILNLCLWWHFLRNQHFVAEVTFNWEITKLYKFLLKNTSNIDLLNPYKDWTKYLTKSKVFHPHEREKLVHAGAPSLLCFLNCEIRGA